MTTTMLSRSNTAVVLFPKGSSVLSIALRAVVTDGANPTVVLEKTMQREAPEPAEKTLERMRMLLTDKKQPQPPRPKGAGRVTREELLASLPPAALLDADGVALDVSQPNAEVWQRAATLVLGPHTLCVVYNMPTVVQMMPPSVLISGHPATCANLSLVSCVEEDLQWEWVIGSDVVCTTRVFTPTEEHIGHTVGLRCRVNRNDNENGEAGAVLAEGDVSRAWMEAVTPTAVAAAPPDTSMPRWAFTQWRACDPRSSFRESGVLAPTAPAAPSSSVPGPSSESYTSATPGPLVRPKMNMADPFRVVSYNILHDRYCISNYAKYVLYPFASDEIRALSYRKGAIARELSAYRGDIVLLQECGQGLFESFLMHTFRHDGMEAHYTNKCGQTKEGNVIAFATDRFEAVTSYTIPLNAETLSSQHTAIAAEVEEHPHLYHALQQMTAVAAVVVLRDRKDENRHIIVANTHLFYHPNACHIRALQVYMLAQAIAATADALRAEGKRVHVILGGDFNFSPTGGPFELLAKGTVSATRNCWDKGFKFWWGCDDEKEEEQQGEGAVCSASALSVPPQEVFRAALTLPMTFEDTLATEPTRHWTNYSLSFKAVIDFIFAGRFAEKEGTSSRDKESVRTLRTIPLPSEADLKRHTAIPSAMFPSDHIAQVVDLAFATTAVPVPVPEPPVAVTAVGVAGTMS